jgi:PAS domain S-box-containing protein
VAQPLAFRADRAVAAVMAETEDESLLYPRALEAIAEALSCKVGAVWEVDPDRQVLTCVETWCSADGDCSEFAMVTKETEFEAGAGLPGRVWMTGSPAWIVDLADDSNFPRIDSAIRAGLTTAFCFPLRAPSGVLGVIELYTHEPRIPDGELLAEMASLGGQLGQFVVRRRAERSVRESEARKRAILAAALDCVITIDHTGRVIEFNEAAEKTFGYTEAEALGREMVDLIVPPSLRVRHRAGFARYLETGSGSILGKRIEITGMRSDGTEFPVELTITRINLPGPPMFTGYVRDITERKQAEAELRASRARLVRAGDEARRRLERDLHDGAQQRLVNLGLTLQLARARLREGGDEALVTLDEAIAELVGATAELRELARGIHPAVLSDGGLSPALMALAERSKPRARIREVLRERLPAPVESTAYFVVAEALTNATRHAEAGAIEIMAVRDGDVLTVEVRDDGRGGAVAGPGSGLGGLADRVAALGGSLEVESETGKGTTVRVEIPCG